MKMILNGYRASDILGGWISDFAIPSSIDNKEVTGIKEYAFNHWANFKTVFIPKTITSIGYGAFLEVPYVKITVEKGSPLKESLTKGHLGYSATLTFEE